MISSFKDIVSLLPNWLSSLIGALLVATGVYLSTNQTWGWHDGIAFVATYGVTWYTTYVAMHPPPNPLGIKPIGGEDSGVK